MNNRHSRSKTWTVSCTAIQHVYCLFDFVPFGPRNRETKKERNEILIYRLKDHPLASKHVDDNL